MFPKAAFGPLWLGAAAALSCVLVLPVTAQESHTHSDLHTHAADMFPRSPDFDFDAPRPGSYSLPVIKLAPDGDVLLDDGKAVRLHDLMAGRVAVLSFIYTRCSDARGCPLSTGLLHDIQYATRGHSELTERVRLISLSFDPANDTPQVMAEYGAIAGEGGVPWKFLSTASEADLRPILAGYGQTIDRAPNITAGLESNGTGVIYHLLRVYLVDQQGRIRNIYGLGYLDPRLLIADILTLLIEEDDALQGNDK